MRLPYCLSRTTRGSHHPSSSHPIRTSFPIYLIWTVILYLILPPAPTFPPVYWTLNTAACPDYLRLLSEDFARPGSSDCTTFIQLVKALQTLTPTPPATAVTPSPVSPPTQQPATVSPRLAFPDKFDGSPSKCKGFLLQCSIFVNQQPTLYPTDASKISFVCSLLTGKALDWATAVWGTDGSVFPTFNYFLQRFREVFDHPSGGKNAGEQLLALSQGSSTAAEFTLNFRTLAAQTTWVEDTLKLLFCRGLNTDLQTELACRDEGRSLEEFIELAIHIDNLIRSRRPSRFNTLNPPSVSLTNTHPEPMQLGFTRLTPEERERRIQLHLCLYCGKTGHLRASCPPRPSASSLKMVSPGEGRVTALTEGLKMQVGPEHSETLKFYVISSPNHPLILGLPWLQQHEPYSWKRNEIRQWGPDCYHQCIPASSRIPVNTITCNDSPIEATGLPAEYHDLIEAFSKSKATQLPPHRPSDCAIELLPGTTPPKGRIFPLSQPESEAMKNYIEEELSKGFIRPSTSPAAAGFFFVKKKDAALEQLRQAKYFTKLDLRSAYNLFRIREGDEWKTAFSTSSGHYEYCVMPFGLANSPSVFQSFINDVFRDMLDRWVIVYIDDILIYSSSLQEHILHVRAVLQRLIKHQLYAKAEKCEFHQMSISFLGYIISHEGVSMDEAKVRAVTEWPQPRTLKELQRFLGFANFYQHFIRGFNLQQPPYFRLPDPSLPFVVEVEASSTGIGAILSQRHGSPAKMFPCAYYSRKLSSAERNYDVGNRELLAMKSAMEEWRHWLEGAEHPFTILTDHKNLEYLRSAKRLNPRQARWALFFTRFNFTVTYRPGTKNTKADSLSRMTESTDQPNTEETIIPENLLVAPVQWDIITEINLTNEQHPPPPECPPQLTYVPETHREQLLQQVHSTPSSGHPGITATLHLLKNRFWWPTINQDTQTFVKNCTVCNTCKPSRQLPAGLLQPLPIPQCPWSHIAIDFVTDLPNSQGKTTILTVVECFSKSCQLIPLPKLPTALETAETLCNFVFRFYGLPEDILSDRGPQFTSRANGQTERLNQELACFLRTYCHSHQTDWSRYLMWAEYAQNSLLKPATGLTPFKCVLGYQPPLFPWSGEPSDLPPVNEWLQRSEETWNRAHIHLQRAVRHQVEQANRHRHPNPEYTPGQCQPETCVSDYPAGNLSPRYVGPFKILRQITPVSFHLELPSNYHISPTFHVSLLKPADGPGEMTEEEGAEAQMPPPILVDGEEAYQVRDLLNSRHRGGVLQYLVDWEGYGPEERSWVNARDILDPTLKEAFHQAHPEKPAPAEDPGINSHLASGACM
ncbi:Transposon Tf2-9 polyprotein [Labeo rohita]|uniref:Gypsy retrotransposon integrase-like protein 1 n=1 Tax=Labeo rohita TaxID=84645 RepID=A0ABQ8LIS5_LABRO|nr:Transposon Tf2-9 polyprotein [Labeo rohita]